MATLLIEPHLDDAVLFSSFVLLREQPTVITVCGDARVQEQYGISGQERREEAAMAMNSLAITDWRTYHLRDDELDAKHLEKMLRGWDERHNPDRVWAPLWEHGGHQDHNVVSAVATVVFGKERLSYYATYLRGGVRSRTDTEVIPEPDWPARKFAAMACYRSQINLENCRPWFAADDCLREWVVT